MGFLNTMLGRSKEPTPPPVEIRDTLFGDMPINSWTGNGSASQEFPWSAFVLGRARMKMGDRESAIKNWREVINHPGLEPRHYLQAWNFLRAAGVQPPPEIAKKLLGVVVEVGMPKGLDIIAAYPDYSARYYNYSGSSVIWEHPDNSMNGHIDALLAVSEGVVAQIGPWDQARPPAPATDHIRLSFLTPSGLHFGQAHLDVMSKEPRGADVLNLAAGLMNALIDRALAARKSN